MRIGKTSRLMPMWLLLPLIGYLAGCATTKPDWDGRVDNTTFDSVVLEMGPPDKQARLQDGSVVAEWITRPSSRVVTVVGGWYPCAAYPPMDATMIDYRSPDLVLRLTFDADGKLQSWKKLRR